MKEETKGLYLAIVLSTIAILAVNWIWPAAPIKTNAEPPAAEEIQPEPAAKDLQKQPLPQERPSTTITEALKADKRVDIANAKIVGSLRLKGARFDNLYLMGRNGMHRYNNMDHSVLTAMTVVDNIAHQVTDKENIWSINTEQAYHEEKQA